MDRGTNRRPLIAAGTLLGIGLGGFVDGIVFHQVLQLHQMLSARYPKVGVDAATAVVNIEVNMFWDGLFHALTWAMTALGLALLWRAVKRPDVPLSTATLVGSLPLGWGLFNTVEGLIDHQLLGIHHVVEAGDHLLWDMVFLGSGAVLILIGWAVIRAGRTGGDRLAGPGGS
jgi:uncharacterized membrane protein